MSSTKGMFGIAWDICGPVIKKTLAFLAAVTLIGVAIKCGLEAGVHWVIIMFSVSVISIIMYHLVFFLVMCYRASLLPNSYDQFVKRYSTREEAILGVIEYKNTIRPAILYIFILSSFPVFLVISLLDMAIGADGGLLRVIYPYVKECYHSKVWDNEKYCDKRFKHRISFEHWNGPYSCTYEQKRGKMAIDDVKDVDNRLLAMMDPEE